MALTHLFAIAVCIVLACEDFFSRKISWYWLLFLLISILAEPLMEGLFLRTLRSGFINIFIIGIQLLLLSIFISIRQKRFVNIIDQYLGSGDVLMLFVIAFAFHPIDYMVFYLISLLTAILAHVIWYRKDSRSATVPLVSFIAIVFIASIVFYIPDSVSTRYSGEITFTYLQQFFNA